MFRLTRRRRFGAPEVIAALACGLAAFAQASGPNG